MVAIGLTPAPNRPYVAPAVDLVDPMDDPNVALVACEMA